MHSSASPSAPSGEPLPREATMADIDTRDPLAVVLLERKKRKKERKKERKRREKEKKEKKEKREREEKKKQKRKICLNNT